MRLYRLNRMDIFVFYCMSGLGGMSAGREVRGGGGERDENMRERPENVVDGQF